MEIVFQKDVVAASQQPSPGEIYLVPSEPEHRDRRDLTGFVLEKGAEALARGPGEPRRVILQADPTLDDLLAAAFVERLLGGLDLPAGARAFARYTELAREGFQPGEVPLEFSLEGIYLAVREKGGDDLSDPESAARFLSGWERMTKVIWAAAEAGIDPFTTPMFREGEEFARERSFLTKDRDVYKQDVLRGERWLVTVPGGPPTGSALILKSPKSLLFKYWSRRDDEAPEGGAYLFLGVSELPGQWVFSTDPVQRLPIEGLAKKLQEAEAARDAERAGADPWFDGAPFAHTLVAAPRGNTLLDDREVLGIVSSWLRGRKTTGKGRFSVRPVVAAAAVVLAVLAVLTAYLILSPEARRVDFRSRGRPLDREEVKDLVSEGIHVPGYAVVIGVGNAQDKYHPLEGACSDAARVYRILRERYGFAPENMRLLVDVPEQAKDADGEQLPVSGRPDLENVHKSIRELGDDVLRYTESSRTNFVFYYSGHGHKEMRAKEIGHLVLSGFDSSRPDATGMSMTQLSSYIQERIDSSHQLLLIDSCFSGFAVVAKGANEERLNPSRIYDLWKRRAHVIVTAGNKQQLSWEADEKSIFTRVLLDGLGKNMLADDNRDGVVTDGELGGFLEVVVPEEVKKWTEGRRVQNPMRYRGLQGDDVGQFLFIPR